MVPILKEILMKEIGEANLPPLDWKQVSPEQYKFLVDVNDFTEVVNVDFEEISDEFSIEYYLPPLHRNIPYFYNIAYEVSGSEVQFAESDMKTLLKILSTIVDIIKDFINKNQPEVMFLQATEKNNTSKQKANLYQAFLKQGIKQISGYQTDTYRDGNVIVKI
jgi:hypothetical protein